MRLKHVREEGGARIVLERNAMHEAVACQGQLGRERASIRGVDACRIARARLLCHECSHQLRHVVGLAEILERVRLLGHDAAPMRAERVAIEQLRDRNAANGGGIR